MNKKEYFKNYYKKNKKFLLNKAKKYYLKNRTEKLIYNKKYYSIPENAENNRRYKAIYFQKNKKKIYKYRTLNKIKVAKWDKIQRIKRDKRIKKGYIDPEVWFNLLEYFEGHCAYCKKKRKLEMDHIKPLSKGGKHDDLNILPVCRKCNASKGNKLLEEWNPKIWKDYCYYMEKFK